MTVLVTGGTGKTGAPLTKLLHASGIPVIVASRSGKAPEGLQGVKFDWLKAETYENPFNAASDITKVYIVGPDHVFDALRYIKPFLEFAASKGVKRFVALSSCQSEPGDLPTGIIHQVLLDLGVDYAVVRPTWFIENFSNALVCHGIAERDEISTSSGNGRVPFISAQDIAQAAFNALTSAESPNTDILIFGPQLLSYDDAANLLSSVIGRKITHRRITEKDQAQILSHFLGADYANYLARLEHLIGEGLEESLFKKDWPEGRKFVGKVTLLEYFEANKDLWIRS